MTNAFPGIDGTTFHLVFDKQSDLPVIWRSFEKAGQLKILSDPHKVYKLVKVKGHRRVVFEGYEYKAELL